MHTTIIATFGFMGFQISSSLKSFIKDNFVVQTVNSRQLSWIQAG